MPVPDFDADRVAQRDAAIRARQRSRSIVTAAILFALVVLFFAISIAKMV